ncbi:MAG: Crp/Fnr family transcriptional regulator [Candidatus Neomarinimicrobiota bacterium]|nr:MAG: Crp/Fnr family transcriptional regulator [Candidatus Neomarinimicrobiota bacterium]
MSEKTKLWYLQNFNLFEGVKPDMMKMMEEKTHMTRSGKKEIIYFPEEPSDTIYFLKEGKIKISRLTEDGRSMTLQLLGPGEIFGESSLLGQEKHENIAEVVEDALICSISKDQFQEMMNENPMLTRSVHKFIGFRLRKIESHLEDLVFKNARERVESFLKRYVRTFGKKMVDGWRVRPFLTHQEIADLTATARQTVNTILNDLVQAGTISYSRRYFHVHDPGWLQES